MKTLGVCILTFEGDFLWPGLFYLQLVNKAEIWTQCYFQIVVGKTKNILSGALWGAYLNYSFLCEKLDLVI